MGEIIIMTSHYPDTNIPIVPMNPEIHPHKILFSIWDREAMMAATTDQLIIIGRDNDDDAVVVDLSSHHGRLLGVSRRHAVIFLTETGVGLRDLDSANGTSCNGTIVGNGMTYDLQDGDKIKLGGLSISLYFSDES
ncbi:MAG: FHA domain-containing protein [Phototrophicaceae bacterium]